MKNLEEYWDNSNDYSKNWTATQARIIMSKQELSFINFYLKNVSAGNVLDIGVGTGRILENILNVTSNDIAVYGVDISNSMLSACRTKFESSARTINLKQCDISKDDFDFPILFDLITAIRVLKYSENWKEIIKKINNILKNDGIFILTMPNKYSINYFHHGELPIFRTTIGELKKAAAESGFRILEIKSYSKLPDFFYTCGLANNNLYVKLINQTENRLTKIFGDTLFGRGLFIALKKV